MHGRLRHADRGGRCSTRCFARAKGEIDAIVARVLGLTPKQQKVTDLMLALRYGPL